MYFSSLDVDIDCSITFDHSAAPDCPIARKLSPSFPITLFFTKKKKVFVTLQRFVCQSGLFGLNFTWQKYLQYLTP